MTRTFTKLLTGLLLTIPLVAVSAETSDLDEADVPVEASKVAGEPASLTLTIDNINRLKGDIVIGLFDSEGNYKADTSVNTAKLPVKDYVLTTDFSDLKSGQYAIKLFHDKDSDGKLDTNMFGAPSERYAFSNGARDPFSEPEWEETVFDVTPGENAFTVSFKDKGRKSPKK